MWQGDPQFWAGRNPILFPMVGGDVDQGLSNRRQNVKMGNHGFARHSEFAVESVSEDTIVLSLSDNEETPRAVSVCVQAGGYLLAFGQNTYHHLPDRQSFPADDAVLLRFRIRRSTAR